ncbi:hypothetical protein JTE90_021769 [Oedothorax gibbosus]|uniref:Uncharacterized protein n=1 Tax=Oedothorax gibbosus TaxID=931172 RepID=A0AAV6TJF4_9ARAC|nr:hypothetical protein JTE90_021769 [Oedothorax gibbosus]
MEVFYYPKRPGCRGDVLLFKNHQVSWAEVLSGFLSFGPALEDLSTEALPGTTSGQAILECRKAGPNCHSLLVTNLSGDSPRDAMSAGLSWLGTKCQWSLLVVSRILDVLLLMNGFHLRGEEDNYVQTTFESVQ